MVGTISPPAGLHGGDIDWAAAAPVAHYPPEADALTAMAADLRRFGLSEDAIESFFHEALCLIDLYLQQRQQGRVQLDALSWAGRAVCRRAGLDRNTSEAWLAELFRAAGMAEAQVGQLLVVGRPSGARRPVGSATVRRSTSRLGGRGVLIALALFQLAAALLVVILHLAA